MPVATPSSAVRCDWAVHPTNGDRWGKYISWSRLTQLREVISLDGLCANGPIGYRVRGRRSAVVRRSGLHSSSMNIGTPGKPWGDEERALWRSRRVRSRDYEGDVVRAIEPLREHFDVLEYGRLQYEPQTFVLYAIRSRNWSDSLPIAIVTGGVHGYETSGVLGALQFAGQHLADYAGRLNVFVAPCVSPWAYERIQRWNPQAIDPNRSFRENSTAAESAALWDLVAPIRQRVLVHIDLHETTDSDESEFRPAMAARDGKPLEPGTIPDGFYLVDDSETAAARVPKGRDRRSVSRHAHRAGRRQGRDHRFARHLAGRHRVRTRQTRAVRGNDEGQIQDDHRGLPRAVRVPLPEQECAAAQVAAVGAALDYALADS